VKFVPCDIEHATYEEKMACVRRRHKERMAAIKDRAAWQAQIRRLTNPPEVVYIPPDPPPPEPLSQTWCERFILALGDGEFRSAVRHCLEVA